MLSRRSFFLGLVAAPAVLRLGLWMPVRSAPPVGFTGWDMSAEGALVRALHRDLGDALIHAMRDAAPLHYDCRCVVTISEVCERVLASYEPAALAAHVDASYKFMMKQG
jgi:hypothetical protein